MASRRRWTIERGKTMFRRTVANDLSHPTTTLGARGAPHRKTGRHIIWTLAILKEKKGRRGLGGRMRASQLHSTPKCHANPFHPDCTTARLLCFGDDRSEFLQRPRASLRRYSGSWTAHRRRRSAGDGQRARPALRQLSPLLQPRLLGSDAALVPA